MPDNFVPKSVQGKWLHELCQDFVKEYVFQSDKTFETVKKAAELEDSKRKSSFECRAQDCDKQYVFHSMRVRCVVLIGMTKEALALVCIFLYAI